MRLVGVMVVYTNNAGPRTRTPGALVAATVAGFLWLAGCTGPGDTTARTVPTVTLTATPTPSHDHDHDSDHEHEPDGSSMPATPSVHESQYGDGTASWTPNPQTTGPGSGPSVGPSDPGKPIPDADQEAWQDLGEGWVKCVEEYGYPGAEHSLDRYLDCTHWMTARFTRVMNLGRRMADPDHTFQQQIARKRVHGVTPTTSRAFDYRGDTFKVAVGMKHGWWLVNTERRFELNAPEDMWIVHFARENGEWLVDNYLPAPR